MVHITLLNSQGTTIQFWVKNSHPEAPSISHTKSMHNILLCNVEGALQHGTMVWQ